MLLASNFFFFYFYFLSPMAEQAAMRDVLRYVRGGVNGRDRWADGRAGGYAGRTELRQG
jgi:hypothetical protein